MMKWEKPVVEELEICETNYNWTGVDYDGGYVADTDITGQKEWEVVS